MGEDLARIEVTVGRVGATHAAVVPEEGPIQVTVGTLEGIREDLGKFRVIVPEQQRNYLEIFERALEKGELGL